MPKTLRVCSELLCLNLTLKAPQLSYLTLKAPQLSYLTLKAPQLSYFIKKTYFYKVDNIYHPSISQ